MSAASDERAAAHYVALADELANDVIVNGVKIEGGWSRRRGARVLSLRISDPMSGCNLAEVELSETQVLNLLSASHDGTVSGSFRVFPIGMSRLGQQHVMVTVDVPYDSGISTELDHYNRLFAAAHKAAGGSPWLPIQLDSINGHRIIEVVRSPRACVYRETMHGYFDAELSLDEIFATMRDPERGSFSGLRTMKDAS